MVNVKDYGALGDGATDDYAAFAAAVTALGSTGGVLYVPPGTYILNSTLAITTPVSIRGSGVQCTILKRLSGTGDLLTWTVASGIFVRDLSLNAGSLADATIKWDRVLNSLIEHVRILNPVTYGLWMGTTSVSANDGTSWNVVSNLNLTSLQAAGASCTGIYLSGNAAVTSNCCHNQFFQVRLNHKNGPAVDLVNADNNAFHGLYTALSSGGTAYSVTFRSRARGNYFYHLEAANGVLVESPADAAYGNLIVGYDRENSEPEPTVAADANLVWLEAGRGNPVGLNVHDALKVGTKQYNTPLTSGSRLPQLLVQCQVSQAVGTLDDGVVGIKSYPGDRSDVVTVAVTGATNATPIVITTASAHGFSDGDRVNVYYVAGNTAANGTYYVKRTGYSATTFGLYSDSGLTGAVAGSGTYQSGSGFVSNRPFYYGMSSTVLPTVGRGNLNGLDDVDGYIVFNGGDPGAKATDAFYLGRNSTDFPSDSEWVTGLTMDANLDYGIRLNGAYKSGAIDLSSSDYAPGGTGFYFRTPRDNWLPAGFGLGTQTPAYGLHQLGGSTRLQALATPAAPTTAVGGGTPAGSSSFYFVVAEDRAGNRTLVSAASSSAAAGSSTANWRKVTWSAVAGAVKYYVLRNTSSTAANTTLLLNTGTWTGTGVSSVTVTAGGSGYSTAPTVSFYGGQGGTAASATLSGSTLGSVAVLGGGSQYTSVPTVVVSGGGGSGATCTASLGPYSATVAAGGSSYAVGDYLTLSGGTSTTTALFRVDAVSGGAVTSVSVQRAGAYSVLPSNPAGTTTGGSGTGCTLTVLWNVSAVNVTAAGTGYTSAPTISFSGGGGSPAATANVAANAVTSIVVTAPGSGELLTSIPGRVAALVPTVVITHATGTGAAATCSLSALEADDSGQAANGAFTVPTRNATADVTADGKLYLENGLLAAANFVAGGSLYASTANATVATNTTATVIGSGVGTLTLPANFLAVGKTVRLQAKGYVTTTASPSTVIFIVKLGSTTVANTNNGVGLAPTASMTAKPWELVCDIACRTAGASGTVMAEGNVRMSSSATAAFNAANLAEVQLCSTGTPAAVTVDTTASQAVDLQVTAAGTGTTVVCTNCTVEVLG